MGADDYIIKPFQIGELIARVEAVIRRTMPYDDTFSYKGVTVNRSSRQVLKDGVEVALAPKEYELLNMLILNKNVALSREQLYEAVWQEEYYGDTRTLDNHIKSRLSRFKRHQHPSAVKFARFGKAVCTAKVAVMRHIQAH